MHFLPKPTLGPGLLFRHPRSGAPLSPLRRDLEISLPFSPIHPQPPPFSASCSLSISMIRRRRCCSSSSSCLPGSHRKQAAAQRRQFRCGYSTGERRGGERESEKEIGGNKRKREREGKREKESNSDSPAAGLSSLPTWRLSRRRARSRLSSQAHRFQPFLFPPARERAGRGGWRLEEGGPSEMRSPQFRRETRFSAESERRRTSAGLASLGVGFSLARLQGRFGVAG